MNEIEINGEIYIKKSSVEPMIKSKYVIVRTYSAGVFAGNIESQDGKHVVMLNARRLWYWDGGSSLSELAVKGTSKPENCKFPCPVDRIELTEVIEILNVTDIAKKSIESVKEWSSH